MSVSRLTGGNSIIFGRRAPAATVVQAKRSYTEALEEFKKSLKTYDANLLAQFEVLRKERSPPSQDDIVQTITSITNCVAEKHTSHDRKYATNISGFFEGLIKLAPVGDVIIGGAQNLAASGVWGAVRLALEVSVSYLTFFEKVSDLFLEIGKFTEINHELAVLFPHSLALKALALGYLSVVIQIATKIFDYAQKSRTKQLFSSVFADFKTTVEPLTTKLQTLAESIKSSASVEAAKANQVAHISTQRGLSHLMAFSRISTETKDLADWKYRVVQRLKAGGKSYGHKWSYYFGKGRSTWLLNRSNYVSWKQSATSGTFWLQGNLGSGKSVAMASVCSDLTTSNGPKSQTASHIVSSYFCKDGEAQSALASTIMDSIAAQIVMSSIMASSFDVYLKTVGGPRALEMASDSSVDLLLGFTPKDWKYYFIIDGLDQLPLVEAKILFGELSRLSDCRQILLCCSSHPTWEGFRKYKPPLDDSKTLKIISMDNINRSSEAKSFITAEMGKWEQRGWHFPSSDAKLRVFEALETHWGNMFLWLKLQMELIEDDLQNDGGYDIEYILGRIHEDLSTLYERRLSEVAQRDPRMGHIILKLVTGADPALKVKELRIAANIEPGNAQWSPIALSKNGSSLCSQYGGKLLEVDDVTDEVRLIHSSVAVHLCGTPQSQLTAPLHFTFREARDLIGLICITYLNIPKPNQSLEVISGSTGSDPSQARGMAMIAHQVMNDSGLDRSLLAPVLAFRGNKDCLNATEVIGRVLSRQTADYVLAHLQDYTRTHWLSSTQHLAWEDVVEDHWNKVLRHDLPAHLSTLLKDPRTGIKWAITAGHRPLFSGYIQDRHLGHMALDDGQYERLTDLLLFSWTDFNTPAPLLIQSISWLFKHHQTVFPTHWKKFIRLAYVYPPMDRGPRIVDATVGKLLQEMSWHFLELLLKSTDTGHEEFSAMLELIKNYVRQRINEVAITLHAGTRLCLTPIAYAVWLNYNAVERVTALMSAGASPADGREDARIHPLFIAIDQGDVAVLKALIDYSDDLEWPIMSEEESNLMALQFQSQNVHIGRNWAGDTSLHVAARRGTWATLECLLSKGCGQSHILEATNNFGHTALFVAIHQRLRDCVGLLLEAGARLLLNVDKPWYVSTTRGILPARHLECLLEECPSEGSSAVTKDESIRILDRRGAISQKRPT